MCAEHTFLMGGSAHAEHKRCDDMMLMTLYANIEDDVKMGSETSIENALEDHSRLCNAKCVKILLAVGIFV